MKRQQKKLGSKDPTYGDLFYFILEERDRVYYADLSGLGATYTAYRDILERYKDWEGALLPRFSHFGYNKKIKEILKYVGIDRMVRVLDPKTREDVARPLYEVATTHTARKTFIGNLYKQVKDPNLIASMSGHSEGSRAFARYRKIDDEMKKELVNLLD